jgi:hypothetical protein
MSDLLGYFEFALGIFYFVEIVVGTIGNLLIILVSFRKRLRRVPTFVFIGFIAIADIIFLYGMPLFNALADTFQVNILFNNLIWCKIGFYLFFFPGQWSAWILVRKKKQIIRTKTYCTYTDLII